MLNTHETRITRALMSFIFRTVFVSLIFFFNSNHFIYAGGTTPGGDTGPSLDAIAVSQSIKAIHNDLETKAKNSVILLGNNGAGKSTLASSLAGEELLAKYVEDIGTVVIESDEKEPQFAIKRQEFIDDSDQLIPPVKSKTSGDVAIWDFPGFSENPLQKLFTSYCLKRILANSENSIIVLVTSETSLQERGAGFFKTVENFAAIIETEKGETIEKSLFLVVTHMPSNRKVEQVANQLKNMANNVKIPIIKKISENLITNLFLFPKPEADGDKISNEIATTLLALEFPKTTSLAKCVAEDNALSVCQELCGKSSDNLSKISGILGESLKNPWLSTQKNLNPLSRNAGCLNDLCSKARDEKTYHDCNEYFLPISQIEELIAIIEKYSKDGNNGCCVDLMKELFHVLETYVVIDGDECDANTVENLRTTIQHFAHFAHQEMIYAQSFADFLNNPAAIHQLNQEITFSIIAMKKSLQQKLSEQISNFEPNYGQGKIDYFEKAIELLKSAEINQSISERQSRCHQEIGKIYVAEELDYRSAALAYVDALKLNPQNRACYKSLGSALTELKLYADALLAYRVIQNTVKLKECSKQLIASNKKDWETRELIGDAWLAVGDVQKALRSYWDARSLNKDETQIQTIGQKISQWSKSGSQELATAAALAKCSTETLSDWELEEIESKVSALE